MRRRFLFFFIVKIFFINMNNFKLKRKIYFLIIKKKTIIKLFNVKLISNSTKNNKLY